MAYSHTGYDEEEVWRQQSIDNFFWSDLLQRFFERPGPLCVRNPALLLSVPVSRYTLKIPKDALRVADKTDRKAFDRTHVVW